MMERLKNVAIVLGLIGGLVSMGGIIGGFVSVVRHWDHFVYMSEVVNANDVRHYHEVVKPRVEELWAMEQKEAHQ